MRSEGECIWKEEGKADVRFYMDEVIIINNKRIKNDRKREIRRLRSFRNR